MPINEDQWTRRRAYQKKYYRAHLEKCKEYQKIYGKTYKRTIPGGKANRPTGKRNHFNRSDILWAPTNRAVEMINAILSGHAVFGR